MTDTVNVPRVAIENAVAVIEECCCTHPFYGSWSHYQLRGAKLAAAPKVGQKPAGLAQRTYRHLTNYAGVVPHSLQSEILSLRDAIFVALQPPAPASDELHRALSALLISLNHMPDQAGGAVSCWKQNSLDPAIVYARAALEQHKGPQS